MLKSLIIVRLFIIATIISFILFPQISKVKGNLKRFKKIGWGILLIAIITIFISTIFFYIELIDQRIN